MTTAPKNQASAGAIISSSISEVDADAWNTLLDSDYPFLQHDFLLALEQHDCLEPWGWQPVVFQLYDEDDELIGACISYIKTNSYGEFVFDWAWADAYQRNGLDYYPKLVTAIPFTPARGNRLLSKANDMGIKHQLIKLVTSFCEQQQLSSSHFLFCDDDDISALRDADMLLRHDYQFHWRNHNYRSFDDFLATLKSKRRKNIRRERRLVTEADIQTEIIAGTALTETQWQQLYDFYQLTFLRKSGTATFTLDFFRAMAHRIRAAFAYHDSRTVAGAILYEGNHTLYGRHWGCYDHYENLHFELCYYSGIEYCIANELDVFEPGAQGEHKIWRGFLPVKTQSAHWIAHPQFRDAITDFLQRENSAMNDYGEQLLTSSPYAQQT